VLEEAGIVTRTRSSGDGRRRYVRLVHQSLDGLRPGRHLRPARALFVCTRNSARSQLAAALWRDVVGSPAESAGTHPADRIHPGAVAAARRAGIDLGTSVPRDIATMKNFPEVVVTVCDRAHEELQADDRWLHWSLSDPVATGTRAAFDATVRELRTRIGHLTSTTRTAAG
jgi:protein-tyrosine-phosphatase